MSKRKFDKMTDDLHETASPLEGSLNETSVEQVQNMTHLPESRLLRIPHEILLEIISYLPREEDAIKLSNSCWAMRHAILNEDSLVWRDLYQRKYDVPKRHSAKDLGRTYRVRGVALSAEAMGFLPYMLNERQMAWIAIVRDMVVEGLTAPISPTGPKTLNRLRAVLAQSNFLNNPLKIWTSKPNKYLFIAVQLSLTAFALNPDVTEPCARIHYNMAVVYDDSDETPYIAPASLSTDFHKFLHIRSFWQRHFLHPGERSFFESYEEASRKWQPGMRMDSDGSFFPSQWTGYISCLHATRPTHMVADGNVPAQVQTCAQQRILPHELLGRLHMDLTFRPGKEDEKAEHWRKLYGRWMPLGWMPLGCMPNRDREYFTSFANWTQYIPGISEFTYIVEGLIEPFQQPYGGIDGWSRICMAVRVQCPGTDDTPGVILAPDDCMYAMEGLILPGRRMMLGRWQELLDGIAKKCGPFILWDI
ncbi:hypothetical protein N7532_006259 [Penicillium argentinense]|uniref:F-box domain-containing protein n=1 Tax=Penicillium argentinense TaxID=1131581 RepID=A0A9W9FFG7_9EURO|nr:uncharacterized protein N7532_006259 [Penicillium argentinense]KAJ5099258.1 hypothetical protein N7532_006259 [Penicillium argentinense]